MKRRKASITVMAIKANLKPDCLKLPENQMLFWRLLVINMNRSCTNTHRSTFTQLIFLQLNIILLLMTFLLLLTLWLQLSSSSLDFRLSALEQKCICPAGLKALLYENLNKFKTDELFDTKFKKSFHWIFVFQIKRYKQNYRDPAICAWIDFSSYYWSGHPADLTWAVCLWHHCAGSRIHKVTLQVFKLKTVVFCYSTRFMRHLFKVKTHL